MAYEFPKALPKGARLTWVTDCLDASRLQSQTTLVQVYRVGSSPREDYPVLRQRWSWMRRDRGIKVCQTHVPRDVTHHIITARFFNVVYAVDGFEPNSTCRSKDGLHASEANPRPTLPYPTLPVHTYPTNQAWLPTRGPQALSLFHSKQRPFPVVLSILVIGCRSETPLSTPTPAWLSRDGRM